MTALRDENSPVRKQIAEALKVLEWKPDENVERVWLALARHDEKGLLDLGSAAVEPLISALSHKDLTLQETAAALWGRSRMSVP